MDDARPNTAKQLLGTTVRGRCYHDDEDDTLRMIRDIEKNYFFSDIVSTEAVDRIKTLMTTAIKQIIDHGAEKPVTLEVLFELIALYMDIYQYDNAEIILRRAIIGCRRTYGEDHQNYAVTMTRLSITLKEQRKFKEAEQYFRQALSELRRHFGRGSKETMSCVDGLGYTMFHLGDLNESVEHYKELLAFYDEALGRENPETLTAVNKLANVYKDLRRYEDAEVLCSASLEACRRLLGADHPTTQTSVSILAQLKHAQGKSSQAEEMYRLALSCNEKQLGYDHLDTLSLVALIGTLLLDQKQYGLAEGMYTRALAGYEFRLGPHDVTTLSMAYFLGISFLEQNLPELAMKHLTRSHDGRLKHFGESHPDTLLTMVAIAKSLHQISEWRHLPDALEKRRRAEDTFRTALEGLDAAFGPKHGTCIDCAKHYAELLLEESRYEEASVLCQRIYNSRLDTYRAALVEENCAQVDFLVGSSTSNNRSGGVSRSASASASSSPSRPRTSQSRAAGPAFSFNFNDPSSSFNASGTGFSEKDAEGRSKYSSLTLPKTPVLHKRHGPSISPLRSTTTKIKTNNSSTNTFEMMHVHAEPELSFTGTMWGGTRVIPPIDIPVSVYMTLCTRQLASAAYTYGAVLSLNRYHQQAADMYLVSEKCFQFDTDQSRLALVTKCALCCPEDTTVLPRIDSNNKDMTENVGQTEAKPAITVADSTISTSATSPTKRPARVNKFREAAAKPDPAQLGVSKSKSIAEILLKEKEEDANPTECKCAENARTIAKKQRIVDEAHEQFINSAKRAVRG